MPSAASQPNIKRILLAAVLVPVAAFLIIAAVLVWQIQRLNAAAGWVEHSDLVLTEVNQLQKLTLDMETGLRGFLITGEEDFLQPYQEALPLMEPRTAALDQLLRDDPPQQQRLAQIGKIRREWQQYAAEQIRLRRTGGDYVTAVISREGKRRMDLIRLRFHEFVTVEEELRDKRSIAARSASLLTLGLIGAAALIGGTILSFVIRAQFARLVNAYGSALQTANDLNATLEQRVRDRTREAEERSAQLTEANKELEAFAYSISHDLRAPMRHIAGFAALLRQSLGEKLKADDSENLTVIHHTAKLAGRMVDDLLAFSRIGRAHMQSSGVDMTAVVAMVRKDLQPDIGSRNIEWKIDELPPAHGDINLLKLVMQNLLSNAVKYTANREHAIIEIGSRPEDGGITYFVRDNGTGFNMEFVSKLFGVFQRLHRAEEFEGTGIGLANVRRIIMRHGGRAWAEGSLGKGATFYFWLPSQSNASTN